MNSSFELFLMVTICHCSQLLVRRCDHLEEVHYKIYHVSTHEADLHEYQRVGDQVHACEAWPIKLPVETFDRIKNQLDGHALLRIIQLQLVLFVGVAFWLLLCYCENSSTVGLLNPFGIILANEYRLYFWGAVGIEVSLVLEGIVNWILADDECVELVPVVDDPVVPKCCKFCSHSLIV